MVMPKSLVPALLLIIVRFFEPRARKAASRFSGMPHRPKPDTMIDAPSGMSCTATAASFTTLFMKLAPRAGRPASRSSAGGPGALGARRSRRPGDGPRLLLALVRDPHER